MNSGIVKYPSQIISELIRSDLGCEDEGNLPTTLECGLEKLILGYLYYNKLMQYTQVILVVKSKRELMYMRSILNNYNANVHFIDMSNVKLLRNEIIGKMLSLLENQKYQKHEFLTQMVRYLYKTCINSGVGKVLVVKGQFSDDKTE